MNQKDLIIGAAVGYKFSHVRVFVQSLRRSGYQGRVLFITGDLPEDEVKQMQAWNVDVLPVSQFPGAFSRKLALKLMSPRARFLRACYWWLRFLPSARAFRFRLLSRIGVYYHHISCGRFMYYWDYIDQHPEVERVLLCDVRDVFFQKNPFSMDWGQGLHVSLEDQRGDLGSGDFDNEDPTYDHVVAGGRRLRGVNSYWIRKAYGDQQILRIADKPICCSGVTFGNRKAVLGYIEEMVSELTRLTLPINEGSGFDQGVHNVLLHTGRLPFAKIHENGVGPVFTVHAVKEHELPLNQADQVVDRVGQPVPIVHMYDRSPRLNAIMGR